MLLFLLLISATIIGVTLVSSIILIPVITYKVMKYHSMLDNPETLEKIVITI